MKKKNNVLGIVFLILGIVILGLTFVINDKLSSMAENNLAIYITYGASGLLLFIGLIIILLNLKNRSTGKKLMETGIKVMATITNVQLDNNYSKDGKNPYITTVSFIYQNLMYEAKSDYIYGDVPNILNTFFIKSLPVYFEQGNPKNNYVDVADIEKYIK